MQASSSREFRVAGPFARIFAYALDVLITAIIGLAVAFTFFGGPDEDLQSTNNFLVSTTTQAIYTIVLLSTYSATPGMMALRIYVANPDGSRVLPDAVILRYLAFLVGNLLFGIGLIVSLVLLFADPQRRTIHDRIARTVVLSGRPPAVTQPWR